MSSPSKNHWSNKFLFAFRGVRAGTRGQSSFRVHFVLSALVFVAALWLQVSLVEWCVLLLCIGSVLTAELFNSALESCAKGHHTGLRR